MSKQPSKLNPIDICNEINPTKGLNPVSYMEANLCATAKTAAISSLSSTQKIFLCLNCMKPFFKESEANEKAPSFDQNHGWREANLGRTASSPAQELQCHQ